MQKLEKKGRRLSRTGKKKKKNPPPAAESFPVSGEREGKKRRDEKALRGPGWGKKKTDRSVSHGQGRGAAVFIDRGEKKSPLARTRHMPR